MFDESHTPDDSLETTEGPDGPMRYRKPRGRRFVELVETRGPFGFAGSSQARMDEEDAYYNARFIEV